MTLSDEERTQIDTFLSFVDDACTSDDRYGDTNRSEDVSRGWYATSFRLGPTCCLEVGVETQPPRVRVGFTTSDSEECDEVVKAVEESGDSLSASLQSALTDAGLPWADPAVERLPNEDARFGVYTPLACEGLDDLDMDFLRLRDKTLRLLEGYMIAFGSVIVPEDED